MDGQRPLSTRQGYELIGVIGRENNLAPSPGMHERVVVGLNVVRLRRARGLSQEELALAAKRTRGYMSGLETGKQNATIDT